MVKDQTYDELKKKFDRDIVKLQKLCSHNDLTDWREEWWAIGHSTGFQIKSCYKCNKIVKRRTKCRKCGNWIEDYKEGTGTDSRPLGSYWCKLCFPRSHVEIANDEQSNASYGLL